MADDKKTTRRVFLAGSAVVPLAAFAAYKSGRTAGEGSADAVRVIAGPEPYTAPPSPLSAQESSPASTPTSTTATVPASTLYARPLHFTYARQDIGPNTQVVNAFGTQYTDDQMIARFQEVTNGITTIMPFFLNVKNLTPFANIITKVQQAGITIYPAVGGAPEDGLKIDNQYYYAIVDEYYAKGFDCIRLENLQGFYDFIPAGSSTAWGKTPIDNMIQYCRAKGFKHIMLNPWPRVKPRDGGGSIPFTYPELDATMYQVLLDFDHTTYVELPDQANEPAGSTNWWAGNQTKIDEVRDYKDSIGSSIKILINYEAAPQHKVLANREITYGDSMAKMQITASQCVASPDDLHWCPPWTTAYDGVAFGTWTSIANLLSSMV